jgi:hypothetical protein
MTSCALSDAGNRAHILIRGADTHSAVCELFETGESASLAAALIFCLTPVFAVQGVGTYAEPNALVLMCLLLSVRLLNPRVEDLSLVLSINWLALMSTALLASLVKRENLLLIPVLLFVGPDP